MSRELMPNPELRMKFLEKKQTDSPKNADLNKKSQEAQN